MVVSSAPWTDEIGVWQDLVGSPATWTVHALHWPMPHPNFVPFRSRTSRSTQRRGVSFETSTVVDFPLTLNVTGMVKPLRRGTLSHTIRRRAPDGQRFGEVAPG